MTATWAVVVAALGASALTGLVTLGLAEHSWRRDRKAAACSARYEAYIAMVQAASGLALLAQTLGATIRARSGLAEGLNVTLGIRKPVEPLALGDQLERAMAPLMDAQARVWVRGTQRAIDAANTVMNLSVGVIETAVQSDASGSSAVSRVKSFVRGARRTKEQDRAFTAALADFMTARVNFLRVVRDELGEPTVTFGFGASG